MSDESSSSIGPERLDSILDRAGFDPDRCVLTRRQAEVLALRERDHSQQEIADLFGTSRANISSIEASARRNVTRARETVALAETLRSPVRILVEPGTDIFDVPNELYQACDRADTKVAYSSAELVRHLREAVPSAIEDNEVVNPLELTVVSDGTLEITDTETG